MSPLPLRKVVAVRIVMMCQGVRVQRTILPIVSGNHLYELASQAFGTDVRDITITRQNDAGETIAIVRGAGYNVKAIRGVFVVRLMRGRRLLALIALRRAYSS